MRLNASRRQHTGRAKPTRARTTLDEVRPKSVSVDHSSALESSDEEFKDATTHKGASPHPSPTRATAEEKFVEHPDAGKVSPFSNQPGATDQADEDTAVAEHPAAGKVAPFTSQPDGTVDEAEAQEQHPNAGKVNPFINKSENTPIAIATLLTGQRQPGGEERVRVDARRQRRPQPRPQPQPSGDTNFDPDAPEEAPRGRRYSFATGRRASFIA